MYTPFATFVNEGVNAIESFRRYVYRAGGSMSAGPLRGTRPSYDWDM